MYCVHGGGVGTCICCVLGEWVRYCVCRGKGQCTEEEVRPEMYMGRGLDLKCLVYRG